jgi:hypothetical protein
MDLREGWGVGSCQMVKGREIYLTECLLIIYMRMYNPSYYMKILSNSLTFALLFFICGCTVTTTTDMNGNSTKSVSVGWSQPKAEDPFDRISKHYSSPKLQETNTSKNIFYFSGFGGHKSQLSTMDNVVQGRINDEGTIDVDFALSADYNQDTSERYVLAFRFEKDKFPYQPKSANTTLVLSLDSQVMNLSPNGVNDFSKTKTITQTINGSTEQQKQDRHFISIDFFVDEETMYKITDSKKVTFKLRFAESETVGATLTKNNYIVLNEFSSVLKEINVPK